MEIKQAVVEALKEMIVPEIKELKQEQIIIKTSIEAINKRLGDTNAHLIEQSRRIDETNKKIDTIHTDLLRRIDETNKRIDGIHGDLLNRIDETNKRIETTHSDLLNRIDNVNIRIDKLTFEVARIATELQKLKREESVTADILSRLRKLEDKVIHL